MSEMQLVNKKQWYKIYFADTFNRTLSLSISEFQKRYEQLPDRIYALRHQTRAQEPFILGSKQQILEKCCNVRDTEYFVTEKAPDEHILVQGEYDGLYATITFDKDVMRNAFLRNKHNIGKLQLRLLLGDEYYSLLQRLSERYVDHVIEFSLYDRCVGIKSQRMIIWEIRKY
jgi:hypothetical protein